MSLNVHQGLIAGKYTAMLANPQGKNPKAKGAQFEMFTNKTGDLFDKRKVAVIDS